MRHVWFEALHDEPHLIALAPRRRTALKGPAARTGGRHPTCRPQIACPHKTSPLARAIRCANHTTRHRGGGAGGGGTTGWHPARAGNTNSTPTSAKNRGGIPHEIPPRRSVQVGVQNSRVSLDYPRRARRRRATSPNATPPIARLTSDGSGTAGELAFVIEALGEFCESKTKVPALIGIVKRLL